MEKSFRVIMKSGMPPAVLSEIVFKAIEQEKFYIITHSAVKSLVQLGMGEIMKKRNPVLPPIDAPMN